MQVHERDGFSMSIGDTGWISIRNAGTEPADPADTGSDSEPKARSVQSKIAPLFALAERAPAPLPERYPRLTFLAISLLLLISALTAEVEYLRGAGYYWP